jgi:hypothetical protein
MDRPSSPNRYMLVPQVAEPRPGAVRVRRYSLARVGLTAHSAQSEERLERAAQLKRA